MSMSSQESGNAALWGEFNSLLYEQIKAQKSFFASFLRLIPVCIYMKKICQNNYCSSVIWVLK